MTDYFGCWEVIGPAEPMNRRSGLIRRVTCRCQCGTVRAVSLPNLKAGKSTSCGCYRAKRTANTKTRHGHARKGSVSPEFSCWQSMRARCLRPGNPSYANYGGRGIRISARWDNFENFLADLGYRPSPKHSLDRIDVNGDYSPANCRWATSHDQRMNQRRRLRIEQFSDEELAAELIRRGYPNPLRVPQHHGEAAQ